MNRLLLLRCLLLAAILVMSLMVTFLAFNRDGKRSPSEQASEETMRESGKEVIELPGRAFEPLLQKAIAGAVNQFWKEIYEEFERQWAESHAETPRQYDLWDEWLDGPRQG